MANKLLAFCGWWLVLAVGLGSSAVSAQSAPEAVPVGAVQLLVWNRAGQTIDVEIRVGEQMVYTNPVREGTVAASVEVGRVVQREPGSYVVEVTDRTRNLRDSVLVRIDGTGGQHVGVHLTREGMAFVLTRGDLTRLTPVPASVSDAVYVLMKKLQNP